MGVNGSIEADIPFNEHFFGLVNFGNTCYVNSVLQALYFCRPFREKIIQYKLQQKSSSKSKEHLLNCLAELFYSIVSMKKKKGIVQPKKFITRLRKDNDAFDNLFQQDAHEFLNYLLNTCADILKEEMKEEIREMSNKKELLSSNNTTSASKQSSNGTFSFPNFNTIPQSKNSSSNNSSFTNSLVHKTKSKVASNQINAISNKTTDDETLNDATESSELSDKLNTTPKSLRDNISSSSLTNGNSNSLPKVSGAEQETWIHELFQGILVNETKCLNCEGCSSKEENFLDLSVDVDQNTSISHCLQEFSSMEMLCGECKYYCENCCSKQEAEKRMRIKKLPKILALHLKRFKFVGDLNKFKKLTYRVVFPFELRLFNTTEDCANSDRIYDLVSFVVHCGVGLNRGHYISVVKSMEEWFLFDDEQVEKIEVSSFEDFYGLAQETNKRSETSYILFYESRDNR